MIKVLLVDDHQFIRQCIQHILSDARGIKVIGEAATAEEAFRQIPLLKPDILLLDIDMPGMGGLEAITKFSRLSPDCKIIILTGCTHDIFPERFIRIGVNGYLTKESGSSEMIHAIKEVMQGRRYINPLIANQLAQSFIIRDDNSSPFKNLTNRELTVLMMLVKGTDVKNISDTLFVSPKTVTGYKRDIMKKLNVKNAVELTLLAAKHGLIDPREVSA